WSSPWGYKGARPAGCNARVLNGSGACCRIHADSGGDIWSIAGALSDCAGKNGDTTMAHERNVFSTPVATSPEVARQHTRLYFGFVALGLSLLSIGVYLLVSRAYAQA